MTFMFGASLSGPGGNLVKIVAAVAGAAVGAFGVDPSFAAALTANGRS
jgi:hypothetical protein